MKIFSAEQIRAWDRFTIINEPVNSIDLMERAVFRSVKWILQHFSQTQSFFIFCGTGNNGGDGLAIARLLALEGKTIRYAILPDPRGFSTADCSENYLRVKETVAEEYKISNNSFPEISEEFVLIDALFGTGLNKPLYGIAAEFVNKINQLPNIKLSIDMPSGLYSDKPSEGNAIVHADFTLSFQVPKLAFMIPENEKYTGETVILDIGLHKKYESETEAKFNIPEKKFIAGLRKKRKNFSHKGTYGHAALLTGSYGMLGAAILSARACLRSGVGKLSCFCNSDSYPVLQISNPEAIYEIHPIESWAKKIAIEKKYQSIGAGSGWGENATHPDLLQNIFRAQIPSVFDADALNCIAQHRGLLNELPANAVITPHVKEFENLFGKTADGFARIELALAKAVQHRIFIILKGYRTLIACPDGKAWFNATGNPGMATAGTGDVLTGMLSAFLAQAYSIEHACLLAVYLHGYAGDLAAKSLSQESLTASDLTDYIPRAILELDKNSNFY